MTNERVYSLSITAEALAVAKLDRLDRALLRDCDSPDASVADVLLGLETLIRRIEEAG